MSRNSETTVPAHQNGSRWKWARALPRVHPPLEGEGRRALGAHLRAARRGGVNGLAVFAATNADATPRHPHPVALPALRSGGGDRPPPSRGRWAALQCLIHDRHASQGEREQAQSAATQCLSARFLAKPWFAVLLLIFL